jgi:hypothetical protein
MRILVLKPMLPRYDALGACEQDHIACTTSLITQGHTVRMLTRANSRHTPEQTVSFYADWGIEAESLPFRRQRLAPSRFTDAAYLDGAAWVHALPDWLDALDHCLRDWTPDLLWCLGSYNWPPAAYAKRHGFRTVIRSDNYEPLHMLDEKGSAGANRIRYFGKVLSERRALANANVLAAITPAEQRIYQKVNPRADVRLLPLCALPYLLKRQPRRVYAKPLRVFFMGSTYNVPHNLAALNFVVDEVVPGARAAAPGAFEFHVLGSKVPPEVSAQAAPDLIFDGFVPDLDAHLDTMDIALIPSLFGHGMQQKVFEPLCRGLPTITHGRALAGYPFEDGASVLLASDAESYVRQLVRLQDRGLRDRLAVGAYERASSLFNQAQMDSYIGEIVAGAMR